MRIFGNRLSLGTHSTREANPPPAALGPVPSFPMSIDAAYPRSRQFRRMTPTTLPVGTTPDADADATASVSSAVCGAKPPGPSAVLEDSVSFSSSVTVSDTSLDPGRTHSDSGRISTATKSPSMARFIAARPLNNTESPVASFNTCASNGLYRDVRSPPLMNLPIANPSFTTLASRYSVNTPLAVDDAPPLVRLDARSSGISAPPPGTTKSIKLASFEIDPIHSATLITSIPSSFAFLAFPRSFVTNATRSHAVGGIARR